MGFFVHSVLDFPTHSTSQVSYCGISRSVTDIYNYGVNFKCCCVGKGWELISINTILAWFVCALLRPYSRETTRVLVTYVLKISLLKLGYFLDLIQNSMVHNCVQILGALKCVLMVSSHL